MSNPNCKIIPYDNSHSQYNYNSVQKDTLHEQHFFTNSSLPSMENKEIKFCNEPNYYNYYNLDNGFMNDSNSFRSSAAVSYDTIQNSPNQKQIVASSNEKPITVPQFLSISSVKYKTDTSPEFIVNEYLSVYHPYQNNDYLFCNQQTEDNYLRSYGTYDEKENSKVNMYINQKERKAINSTVPPQNLETRKTRIVPQIETNLEEDKKYFEIEIGPNQYQVKDWFITPTNKLKINFEPSTSDVISVYLKCDSNMGLKDPEIFLGAVSPKFNLTENRCICIPNLKISKEMIQGPTKGFKFRLKYSLLSKGKEVSRLFSEPFLLFSSGLYPDHLKLQKNKRDHQCKFINDEISLPKKQKKI